jgi:flagellar motility protein MotE (MotC chaperone)
MPDLEKSAQEGAQDEAQKTPAKPKLPLKMILIGAGVFVVAIGAFSFTLGLLSSAPPDEAESPPAAAVAGIDSTADSVEVAPIDMNEIARLEKEIFGDKQIVKNRDTKEPPQAVKEEKPTSVKRDSTNSPAWLKAEKDKLDAERAELDALKRELDAKEAHIKKFLAQVDEMESSRINALAKLYDGMQENQVVPLINQLTDEQAVQILMKMKPTNASRILGALSPARAGRISERMITLTEEE